MTIDFVIGAPYEQNPIDRTPTTSSSGAIYIYRGQENLADIKLSQKIFASDLKLPVGLQSAGGLQGFGYSLSGGLDLDASGYPDLAVGALKSNAIALIRTLPVVYVDSFVGNEENLMEIDQKRKECRQDGADLVCFNFDLCFQLNEKKVAIFN